MPITGRLIENAETLFAPMAFVIAFGAVDYLNSENNTDAFIASARIRLNDYYQIAHSNITHTFLP